MPIAVEPLQEAELDEFFKTVWSAFEPLEANMIMPMIFREGLQHDLTALMRHRTLESTHGDLASQCFCAKDSESGQIVGITRYKVVHDPPTTQEDMDAKHHEALDARKKDPMVAGTNQQLDREWFRVSHYAEMETTGGRPYMALQLLAVSPSQQRRGIGSILLKQALQEADRLGLPVYLDCGVFGKPLYERYGFNVMSTLPLDCREYGGRSSGIHWAMLRPARTPN